MKLTAYQKLKKELKRLGKRARYVGGKSEAFICAAEKKLGVCFPPDYRQFLADFGAGKFADTEIFGLLGTGGQENGLCPAIQHWENKRRRGLQAKTRRAF